MQIVSADLISGKRVLLRYDIDVALGKGTDYPSTGLGAGRLQVIEEFKLKAGIPTLNLCLQNAITVTMMGHVGRPDGKVADELRVAPIVEWFKSQGYDEDLVSGKLTILENLRFDPREEAGDLEHAKELAQKGDFYVNEAFSAYRPSVSTTILPTLLPHAAGLHFAEEVRVLKEVRDNPKKPFVAIMGGAKVKDKLPVISILAKNADAVLVGGKLVAEIKEEDMKLAKNVMVGKLNDDGFDIASDTVESWRRLITGAAMIVWNGPLGKVDSGQWSVDSPGSSKGTYEISEIILESNTEAVVGGGDTIAFLGEANLLEKFQKKGFVSVGGGAMLKLIADGTLSTVEALS